MPDFHVVSPYQPAGDQPQAIEAWPRAWSWADRADSAGGHRLGQTFSMAKVIEQVQRPTLVLAKTRPCRPALRRVQGFFPDNAVEYFVSYYDYYQPEAYIPHTDTSSRGLGSERRDRPAAPQRHRLLIERRDVSWCRRCPASTDWASPTLRQDDGSPAGGGRVSPG
jgi:excinuclease ABC subunit B